MPDHSDPREHIHQDYFNETYSGFSAPAWLRIIKLSNFECPKRRIREGCGNTERGRNLYMERVVVKEWVANGTPKREQER